MSLLSVDEAQSLVLKHTPVPTSVEHIALGNALNRVLAEDIPCDGDSPPFDKSMVDGYAIRSSDVQSGIKAFQVIDEVLAGRVSQCEVKAGQAISIMTGAPLPRGADAVVMHEQTTRDAATVFIAVPVKAGQNILRRAAEMQQGEVVLKAGDLLRAASLGLLASVNRTHISCFSPVQISLLTTGDEIVEPGEVLPVGHIRNSNASLLQGLILSAGAQSKYMGIAKDTHEQLWQSIRTGLQSDVLIITGGVSAGKVDLVPDVLKQLGVQAVFHKVALKPGKPLFFGKRGTTLIFGLPGNPVSSLVGFELFLRPALRKLSGLPAPYLTPLLAVQLQSDFQHRSDRPTYHPVKLNTHVKPWQVTPVAWKGSADLRSISLADTFAVFPPGEVRYAAGDWIEVLSPFSLS